MDILITCQYEEDPIKNTAVRVFTTLYINCSGTQGQITWELLVVPGLNLNSSKLSYMSSLPARMRMIDLKNEGARVFTRFLPLYPAENDGQMTMEYHGLPWSYNHGQPWLTMVDHVLLNGRPWLTMVLLTPCPTMVDHGPGLWLTMVDHGQRQWLTMV